jgi:anthranilate synthase component I
MTMLVSEYQPTLAELQSSKLDGRTVAISREILADLDTPVSAYLKVRDGAPSFLLESVEGGERLGRYSFIGSRPRRVLRIKNGRQRYDSAPAEPCQDPLQAIRQIIAAYESVSRPRGRFEGGALGYLSYEAARYFERLPRAAADPLDLPDAVFLDVDTVLVFDHVAHKIRIVSHAWLDESLPRAYEHAVNRIENIVSRLSRPLDREHMPHATSGEPRSNLRPDEYQAMVREAKSYIQAGEILQVVLSQRLTIPVSGDAFALYRRLRAVNPSPFMYYLDFADHQLVGASPELLVQVERGVVSTRPIAGTRRRGATSEEDGELAEELLSDEKERAEHLMLVDLARNDVGRVSRPGSVQVTQFMGIERFSHVMHLVSDVNGTLNPPCDAFDALRACFPAGTVSGAPKIRAMEIIAQLERDVRGPYAGAVGFVSTAGDMEMAITIRTGVAAAGAFHVQAGAGIVADSEPEREYVETMNKARALLEAAGGT